MKYLTIVCFALILLSCGNEKKKDANLTLKNAKERVENELAKTNNADGSACEYLSETFIKTIFPEATNFEPKSHEKPYPTCSYKFDVDGKSCHARLTIAKGFGSEKNLDAAMKYHSEKELLKGVGQKAYYLTKSSQVSVWEGKNIIHVNINGNKETSIKAAKELLSKL